MVIDRILSKYFLARFMKQFLKQAFNNWKRKEFTVMAQNLTESNDDQDWMISQFTQKITNIKG